MRKKARVESLWGEVARAAGLQNAVVGTKITFTGNERKHLEGLLGGFAVEAGAAPPSGGEGGDPGYTYAAVTVTGLPARFEVGRWRKKQPRLWLGANGSWVVCDGGGGREVTAAGPGTVRSEVGGLVIEEEVEGFDLDAFLTPRRREVICSLEGRVVWEGAHQVRTEFTGLPYPRRRDMARAARGDSEATQRLWEHTNKVVELLRTALRDAELATVELTLPTPEPPE